MKLEPHLTAAERLLKIAGKISKELGLVFEFVDVGGGFGVPYRLEDDVYDIDGLASRLITLIEKGLDDFSVAKPELWVEPGRYLVADAGILLTRVNTLKETPYNRFAGVDTGFNILLRPTLYGSYHHIILANRRDEVRKERYDVVGPICESGDVLAKDRFLPRLQEGGPPGITQHGCLWILHELTIQLATEGRGGTSSE